MTPTNEQQKYWLRWSRKLISILLLASIVLCSPCTSAQANDVGGSGGISKEVTTQKYRTAPWELLKFEEFRLPFERALSSQKNVPAWVRRLDIVTVPTGIPFDTPEGTAWAYEGTMPRNGSVSLRLAFIPARKEVGLKLSMDDGRVVYYGSKNTNVRTILDRNDAYEYPSGDELKKINAKSSGERK